MTGIAFSFKHRSCVNHCLVKIFLSRLWVCNLDIQMYFSFADFIHVILCFASNINGQGNVNTLQYKY